MGRIQPDDYCLSPRRVAFDADLVAFDVAVGRIDAQRITAIAYRRVSLMACSLFGRISHFLADSIMPLARYAHRTRARRGF